MNDRKSQHICCALNVTPAKYFAPCNTTTMTSVTV